MGTLYVVGTPIGNMEDITFRQLKTLESVDFIAAEDTRVALRLLNRYEIKKPLVSYHGHSTESCAESIVARLQSGENAAIVTDAGMPCISDPGEVLVRMCAERGIDVKVVPGPSAVVSALAVSGLNTSRFAFEGFLSVNKKQRYDHLESIKDETRTLIFYEAPHKLTNTLSDFLKYFGDRKISLCRELTKIHEEVLRMTVSQAVEYYRTRPPRGEYVLVLEGAKPKSLSDGFTLESAASLALEYSGGGMKLSEACRRAAKETGFPKSGIYTFVINMEAEK
ncbi:MAG: 16S rRNA (cytidine(1402)-2'-O)-methyltransferase [Clostridium sp.]|nr:16S rRNA (cytidine(1402)-2'-O)-methyltransferase [Clostridium sp.]MCM1548329.1 16S rRNA (cytidine(1402)-2'-O)-methyltransferase [Ruminococcus sp.]